MITKSFIVSCLASAAMAEQGRHGYVISQDPPFHVQAYGSAEGVKIEAVIPYNSYLGFTWGKKSMYDVDMLVLQASSRGRVKATDFHGVGYSQPKKDQDDAWRNLAKKKVGRRMVRLTMERDWLPNEPKDYLFQAEQPFTVGYAFSTKSHRIAYHEKNGEFEMKLNTEGTPSYPCQVNCPVPKPVLPPVELQPEVYNRATWGKNLRNGFYVQARLQKPDFVELLVKLPTNSYLGFSLGAKTMSDVDMVLFKNVGGSIIVQDLHSMSYRSPSIDEFQNWEIVKKVGSKGVIVRRKLSSPDSTDYTFGLDKKFTVGFVKYQGQSPEELQDYIPKHQQSGGFKMKVKGNGRFSFPCVRKCAKKVRQAKMKKARQEKRKARQEKRKEIENIAVAVIKKNQEQVQPVVIVQPAATEQVSPSITVAKVVAPSITVAEVVVSPSSITSEAVIEDPTNIIKNEILQVEPTIIEETAKPMVPADNEAKFSAEEILGEKVTDLFSQVKTTAAEFSTADIELEMAPLTLQLP